VTAFLGRIGEVLVRPLAAMRRLAGGREGGLGDVAVLLLLALLAGQTRVGGAGEDSSVLLARAAMALGRLQPALAAQGLLRSASVLLPDLLAIVVGAVVLALLAGGRTGGRELDLAAVAWIPAILVHALAPIVFTAVGRDPTRAEAAWIFWGALAWAALCWTAALVALRGRRDRLAS
jgi:hypothetical protein